MRTIEWSLQKGEWNSTKGTVEVEDDATDKEIDQIVDDIIQQYVSWGWKDVTSEE